MNTPRTVHHYMSEDHEPGQPRARATLILPPGYRPREEIRIDVNSSVGSGYEMFTHIATEGSVFNDALHGLQRRYFVEKIVPGERDHRDCQYFVLDLTHDPNARAAAQTYARLIAWSQPRLADDLTALALSLEPKP